MSQVRYLLEGIRGEDNARVCFFSREFPSAAPPRLLLSRDRIDSLPDVPELSEGRFYLLSFAEDGSVCAVSADR